MTDAKKAAPTRKIFSSSVRPPIMRPNASETEKKTPFGRFSRRSFLGQLGAQCFS